MPLDTSSIRRHARRDGRACFTLAEPERNLVHLYQPGHHPQHDAVRALYEAASREPVMLLLAAS